MAELSYTQKVRIGSQSVDVERREVLEDGLYNAFKTKTTYWVGIPLFLALLVLIGYLAGESCGEKKLSPTKTGAISIAPVASHSDSDEIKGLRSAVEKMAEQKPTAPATPQAPPVVNLNIPNKLTVAVTGIDIPKPPAQPTAPAPKPVSCSEITDAVQRQRCEIWAPLHK